MKNHFPENNRFFMIPSGAYSSDVCNDKKERESTVIEIACRMSLELDIKMTHPMMASFLKRVEMDKELCNFQPHQAIINLLKNH
jgi:hypothetical protein